MFKLFKKKKTYRFPYRFVFIKWTPNALKNGLGERRVEYYEGGKVTILPFLGPSQIKIFERNRIPVFDVTKGMVLPELPVVQQYDPAIIELH